MNDYAVQLDHIIIFAQSIGIGFLIGVEREQHKEAIAGIRTFALISIAGTLSGYVLKMGQYPFITIVMALVIGTSLIVAQWQKSNHCQTDPNTTSVIAGIITFGLGFMLWFGHNILVAAIAIATTAILYFRAELHSVPNKLSRQDITSFFLFAAIAFVLLPVLPNTTYGPYNVINPYQIGWLVVLISGISLAGYLAIRLLGKKKGILVIGFFGGLVSTTATTMVYSRHTAKQPSFMPEAVVIIMLSNLVLFLRIVAVTAIFESSVLTSLAPGLLGGLLLGIAYIFWLLRRFKPNKDKEAPEFKIENPTELKAAISFALIFAGVLLLVAWMNDTFQAEGVYIAAFISGLTDVDAITLSSLRLVSTGNIDASIATNAILVAYIANLIFKYGLTVALGTKELQLHIGGGFLLSLIGILLAWFFLS
ncbi:MgtC/SapB family protein [Alkalimarinus alittae]|uniref:MgtC/SapB family protein n=1 Tax=Alkalimarinus alittae TaxID=2961619 RepID=A0ABY6MXF0_9ALTE|nr:MgtC/SapB family protein [Alkalimarinus alittae]UZE94506.1 MgtC/SapB family protein [Alkalimarinus alittae]